MELTLVLIVVIVLFVIALYYLHLARKALMETVWELERYQNTVRDVETWCNITSKHARVITAHIRATAEGLGLNAGTPIELEPCTISGLREQLRRIDKAAKEEKDSAPVSFLTKEIKDNVNPYSALNTGCLPNYWRYGFLTETGNKEDGLGFTNIISFSQEEAKIYLLKLTPENSKLCFKLMSKDLITREIALNDKTSLKTQSVLFSLENAISYAVILSDSHTVLNITADSKEEVLRKAIELYKSDSENNLGRIVVKLANIVVFSENFILNETAYQLSRILDLPLVNLTFKQKETS